MGAWGRFEDHGLEHDLQVLPLPLHCMKNNSFDEPRNHHDRDNYNLYLEPLLGPEETSQEPLHGDLLDEELYTFVAPLLAEDGHSHHHHHATCGLERDARPPPHAVSVTGGRQQRQQRQQRQPPPPPPPPPRMQHLDEPWPTTSEPQACVRQASSESGESCNGSASGATPRVFQRIMSAAKAQEIQERLRAIRLEHDHSNKRIGRFHPAQRSALLDKHRRRRRLRWAAHQRHEELKKQQRVSVRKLISDKRPRVKGRFVKTLVPVCVKPGENLKL